MATGEIAEHNDPDELAILLVCSLEGALTGARLLGNNGPLTAMESHLHAVLDEARRRPRKGRSRVSRRSR
jgi:hypothetical protein